MSDAAIQAAILLLILILPIAALVRRLLPMTTIATYAGAWLAIAALLYLTALYFT